MKTAQLKCDIKTKGVTLRAGAKYPLFLYTSRIVGRDYWMNECKIVVPGYGIVCVPSTVIEVLED